MNFFEYTISVTNTNSTINKLHNLLSLRKVEVKKSDLKEALSSLMGFETSNILDSKIKAYEEKQRAQSIYKQDSGQHRIYPDVILKRLNSPLKIYDFFERYKHFQTIISFSENFELPGGFIYKEGDVLFARSLSDALEVLLEWKKHANINYVYYEEDKPEGVQYDGYWALALEGNEIEAALGEAVYDDTYFNKSPINNPNSNMEDVKAVLAEFLHSYNSFLFFDGRKDFREYLRDWIEVHYADNYFVDSEEEYIKYIEKYLPYLGIGSIVEMEVGTAPIEYLERLKIYGAQFNEPELMRKAARDGSLETCKYLLNNGNTIEAFYHPTCSYTSTPYLHSEAACERTSYEGTKSFFRIAAELDINLNRIDEHGNTPLHYAAIYKNKDLYEYLVKLGAKEQLKNHEGDTPKSILKVTREAMEDWHLPDVFGLFFRT
jgi:hypothetical protein